MERAILLHETDERLLHAHQDILRQRQKREGQGVAVIIAMIDPGVFQTV